jgi:hypothetical protein
MAKKKAVKKQEEAVEEQTTFNEDDMSILFDEFGNIIEVEDETDLTDEVILDDENIKEE